MNLQIKKPFYGEPLFLNATYCVTPTTNRGIPEIEQSTAKNVLLVAGSDFNNVFLCRQHGLSATCKCVECTPFVRSGLVWILHTSHFALLMPPPLFYTKRNLNVARALVVQNGSAEEEERRYKMFREDQFSGGYLKNILTSKTSMIRNKLLGFLVPGARLTLTIESSLSPHYVKLPKCVFRNVDMLCPIILINRAPSITNTCVYACEALYHEDPTDHTIHVNPFVIDGLHADQDGDELTIFYLKGRGPPGYDAMMAIEELRRLTWKYGIRHDTLGRSRYSFSQFHKHLLCRHDEEFRDNSPIWASLRGSIKQRATSFFELASTVCREEGDDFISLVCKKSACNADLSVPLEDLETSEGGVLREIIESGAKGTTQHIDLMRSMLKPKTRSDGVLVPDFAELTAAFNSLVGGGQRMARMGMSQFNLLQALAPVNYHRGTIRSGATTLMRGCEASGFMCAIKFNLTAAEFVLERMGLCPIE